jgi:hypothetical protein
MLAALLRRMLGYRYKNELEFIRISFVKFKLSVNAICEYIWPAKLEPCVW